MQSIICYRMERRKEGHRAPEGARGPSGSLTSPLRTMSPKHIFNEKSLSSIKPDSIEAQKVVFVSHFPQKFILTQGKTHLHWDPEPWRACVLSGEYTMFSEC